MGLKIIDIADDIDYLSEARAEHMRLVLADFLRNPSQFASAQDLPLMSAAEGATVSVRLPLRREYRLAYASPPFNEQGEGVGQSSLSQESGDGDTGSGSEESGPEDNQDGDESAEQPTPALRRGQVVGRISQGGDGRRTRGPQFSSDSDLSRLLQSLGLLGLGEEGEQDGQEQAPGARRGEGQQGLSFEELLEEFGDQESSSSAGTEPGSDSFEAEVALDNLRDRIAEEFELPDLDLKSLGLLKVRVISPPRGYRRKGPSSDIVDERSVIEHIKRVGDQSGLNEDDVLPMTEEDLQYRFREEADEYLSRAVVFVTRDMSHSMNDEKLEIIRNLSMHLIRGVRKVHKEVIVVLISFHTEAEIRTEWEFLHLKSSGGTNLVTGSRKEEEEIAREYTPQRYNLFSLYFTDGENITDIEEQDQAFFASLQRLLKVNTLFGYFEVKGSAASVMKKQGMKDLIAAHDNLVAYAIDEKEQTKDALGALMDKAKNMRRRSVHAQ